MNRADAIDADEKRKGFEQIDGKLLTNATSAITVTLATRVANVESKFVLFEIEYDDFKKRLTNDARIRNHKQSLQTSILAKHDAAHKDAEERLKMLYSTIDRHEASIKHNARYVENLHKWHLEDSVAQDKVAQQFARTLKYLLVGFFVLAVTFITFLIYFFQYA